MTRASENPKEWGEVINVLTPFVDDVRPCASAIEYLDAYEPEDGRQDVLESYKVLVQNSELSVSTAVPNAVGEPFTDAVEQGLITISESITREVNGTELPAVHLTTQGWKALGDKPSVQLDVWRNTIEIENLGDDFEVYLMERENETYNTVLIPEYLDAEVLFEAGGIHIEPYGSEVVLYRPTNTVVYLVGVQ